MLKQLLSRSSSQTANPTDFDRVLRSGLELASAQAKRQKPVLLARSLYRTRTLSLLGVPRKDRASAVRHLLQAWAPFDDSRYLLSNQGEQTLAWAWDAKRLNAALQDAPELQKRPFVPEGLMRAPMAQDGVRLGTCLEGFEGQCWRAGRPVFSHWWVARPMLAEWQAFLRSARASDLPEFDAVPEATDSGWLSHPWLECVDEEHLGRVGAEWEKVLALLAGCVVVGLAAQEFHGLYNMHARVVAAKELRSELDVRAAPMQRARAEALSRADQANAMISLLTGPQPIEVLKHLGDSLPPAGVTLLDFQLQGDQLRITLALNADVQRATLVKQLRGNGWFDDIAELRDSGVANGTAFTMKVKGGQDAREAAVSAASPASAAPVGDAR